MQCLDNCLRFPYCDKYIFDREENRTCKLLYTGDIASVSGGASLGKTHGKCRPKVGVIDALGSESIKRATFKKPLTVFPHSQTQLISWARYLVLLGDQLLTLHQYIYVYNNHEKV